MPIFEYKSEPPHGTRARYVALKCRCDECKRANREYARSRVKKGHELLQGWDGLPRVIQVPMKDGTIGVITRKRCMGIDHQGCPRKNPLQKRTGPLCNWCRERLVIGAYVDAGPAIAHMKMLQAKGIGREAIFAATDLPSLTYTKLMRGTRKHIRREMAEKILACDESIIADGARVPAAESWKRVDEMMAHAGISRSEVAKRLGVTIQNLRYGKPQVTAARELEIKKLHAKVMAEPKSEFQLDERFHRFVPADEAHEILLKLLQKGINRRELCQRLGVKDFEVKARCEPKAILALRKVWESVLHQEEVDRRAAEFRMIEEAKLPPPPPDFCNQCGLEHTPEARREYLLQRLPASASELKERRSCWWGSESGDRTLYRDLRDVGAICTTPRGGGTWHIPPRDEPPAPANDAVQETSEPALESAGSA